MQFQPWHHACSAGFTLRGEHSPPSGKPVLHFIHGNGYCGRVYEPMLSRLAEHFDLFLSDVQGHGGSDHGGGFLGWNRSAELCMEAWRAHATRFGDAPIYATGHSFGAVLTALLLAHHPDFCRRAVLLDPVLFPPPMIGLMALAGSIGLHANNKLARRARKRRTHWPDRDAAANALRGHGIFKGWREDALQAYVDHALKDSDTGDGVELKCRPTREAEVFGSYPHRLWPSLRQAETPTLVLHGEHSYPFVRQSTLRWATRNPNVRERQMTGGHCFMQQDPDASATVIRDFLLAR